MRDPARIPVILDELKKLWETLPDMRLGQLINVVGEFSPIGTSDLFYLEDDVLLKTLKELQQ